MTREAAAEYLAGHVTGVKPCDLLDGSHSVDVAFESAIDGHRTCGCEHHRRLVLARCALLGIAEGQLL